MGRKPPAIRAVALMAMAGATATVPGIGGSLVAEEARSAPTIAVELVVENAAGQPVSDLRLEEIDVVQDATRQRVTYFRAGRTPGLYEVRYVPLSGRAGGVTVRVRRAGTKVRGPAGAFLKPRVIPELTPIEAELVTALDASAGKDELECFVSLLRFEATPSGVRHAIAVELPLSALRFEDGPAGQRGRLQVLARFRRPEDASPRLITLDRVVEAGSPQQVVRQRLVWTGTSVLDPGTYSVDVLVRDPSVPRGAVRRLELNVAGPVEGLRMSSLVLLRPRDFSFVPENPADDPLVHKGDPLMPSLKVTLPPAAATGVRFYVALYPAPGHAEGVSLRAELWREGTKVGEGPVQLPAPESSGEIRYVGQLATRTFPEGAYSLRLVASQGSFVATEEAAFVISSEGDPTAAPVRLAPSEVSN